MSEQWTYVGSVTARPGLHMALDEVLLMDVAAGRRGPTLRFWEWTHPALVLGANQSLANEVDLEEVRRQGFQITRRMSGGGTMLCQPGATITWSLTLPESMVASLSFRDSYHHLDSWAIESLRELGVPVEYHPINEMMLPSGKLAGAAQARRRGAVLHHVTMAYSVDPELVPRLIRIGREAVFERGTRSAERRVASLDWFVRMTIPELIKHLLSGFARGRDVQIGTLTSEDRAASERLAASKYDTFEWISRLP